MGEPFNTPVPGATPRSQSPVSHLYIAPVTTAAHEKPIVLHIGDEVRYNMHTYDDFASKYTIVRPSVAERQRPVFMQALRDGKWGQFSAIFRPFWGSGGEMGVWDEDLVALLPDTCRVFASAGAGFDWVDTRTLGKQGIVYCNTGLAAAEAVSDFAVAMVISTFRHLPWCIGAASSSDAGAFKDCHRRATAQSRNLRGHVLGIIGMGNIGQCLAEKLGCVAFGMRIHYYDVVRKPVELEARLHATYHSTLGGLLSTADCVVLCTPASIDGKTLINKDSLGLFKPGARFVNVARGSLVDEEALADALEDNQLVSAALDVHTSEPRVNPRLAKLAWLTSQEGTGVPGRVMLTCHNAGGVLETHIGFEELSMRNIMAVLDGAKPITPVNLHYIVGGL
ncbi:d-isomer specific 2-hydroxyacid dehydrogenase [Ophiostoma piceae UAMH 11346]|uniref:D-isomer specific 2-hydroxyacid dehydrogenase n=1 Tax=Ophiostoma piceae (strain UAMH 11346) TaxID=1262450 RepID=S3BTT3_OPHP1|nr:d-isomer specific 2-hydroxyacid dehydrogenase [Ophiostoma piceae UAMH 11346]